MKPFDTPLAIFLAALLAAIGFSPAAAQVVGVTAALRNEVRMTSAADSRMHEARLKERVALGNDIATGKASMAQLLLLDRTSFSVGSSARICRPSVGWLQPRPRAASESDPVSATAKKLRTSDQSGLGSVAAIHS